MTNALALVITLFSSILLLTPELATSTSEIQTFIDCLHNHSLPSQPISSAIYTQNNSSFPSVLQSYIRNLRFNTSTTPKPLLILTALHVSHIQAGVICGREHDLVMKIRSGGHDYEGLSFVYVKPFFILDMFNLRSINISIEEETAWVQTGATLGELYYTISEKSNVHGFPGGVSPTLGLGGHISGGGYGTMIRKYGLSSDNVIDAEIINVKGQLLNRKSMGEDLFWAIRGGGGSSFGVVLSYKLKLVRVPVDVTVFQVDRTLEHNASDLIYRWQEVAHNLDEDIFIRLNIRVITSTTTKEKTIRASFVAVFLGDATRLVSLMNKDFPELGLQISDCQEMSWIKSVLYYTGMAPATTPTEALLSRIPSAVTYSKRQSDYLQKPITKTGWEYIFKRMIQLETPTLMLNPCGGKLAEISEFETPFPHRDGIIAKIQYLTFWREEGIEAENHYMTLARRLYGYMTPYVSKNPRRSFVNYRDYDLGINHNNDTLSSYNEGTAFGTSYFNRNFNRLVKVKTMVDPDNYFRNEQSIPVSPS